MEVQKSTNYLETRITALEKELHSATSRLQSFENRSSRKNILIQGVPESFDISDQTFILEIADEIGFKNLNLFDIDNVIRFRKQKNKTNEPKNKTNVSPALVMVSFVSQSVKQYFMDCYLGYIKSQNNSNIKLSYTNQKYMNTIVYFNEHMDRLTHQIYTKARYLKKSGMIFKVIMKNHQVHIVQSSTSENMVLIIWC